MTDSNTLQALILAAGMATAGGIIFDDPEPIEMKSGVQAQDITMNLHEVDLDKPLHFGKNQQ